MTETQLTVEVGICATLFVILLINFVILHNWRVVPTIISQILLGTFLILVQQAHKFDHGYLLMAALVTALIGIGCNWPGMFRQVHDYVKQWSLVLICLIIIILNQLFWSSLFLFMLPIVICSMATIGYNFWSLRQITRAHHADSKQHSKNEIAIGLDLASGLPNKLAFTDKIDKQLKIHSSLTINLVIFKLTNFELLNSLIGHQNGDMVKLQMSSRIRNILKQSPDILLLSEHSQTAFLATLGGVDFSFAVRDDGKNDVTETLLSKLKDVINEPLLINATAVDVGIQFGVASYPEHGGSAQDLIEQAYLALSYQQQDGTSVYFQNKFESRLHNNRAVISQLREDLNHDRFELFVQPQINLITNEVEGGEVLIRWRRDNCEILAADQFITLAEESGVIYQLSVWCFEQTIKKLAKMQLHECEQYLAVNVSNKELFQSQLVDTIANLLEKYQVAPDKLVVEIKESAFAQDPERALKITRLISHLGVRVGLDEFGKDQSALSCFNKFSPWYVKIDCKSLNTDASTEKNNAYLNAIIGLARNLNINTVGHGVEVESTIHQLRDTQCRLAQGYFYSKPFELSGFETWLEQWQNTGSSLHK
ncbi:GGDEF domain-containing phosphodiesterase [Psychrosphaera sp. 1_MG-2023]|uniref:GGDEF domain-containing phosphodiesterase n=1 Tax=Psychrosphaera sp. 1_MG-2023 TaxID=3062643 RepID=UPI0026E128B2|nr:GGDEF domain-containing phosphodiesterase [Psychrosphaera sp. 1_MG-2023]MDO6720689.1 GGDEF domain-containing phosphodiesterase [Psychrosphaera sp. 1_MG-2023]